MIFFNDAFQHTDNCFVSPSDRGLTLGDGVFDTMLVVDGTPLYPEEHFKRLVQNAGILKIRFTLDFLATAKNLLKVNQFTTGRYAIRTTITRGSGMRGLAPPETATTTIIMQASPVPQNDDPVTMVIAETVRRNSFSPLSRIKSLNYGDNLIALMEAKDKGADDAILLNAEGHVCCASTSNIFIVEGHDFITPPLYDGVLNGITRQFILQKYRVREESIHAERLLKSDAAFLTNSLSGIRAIKKIEDTTFAYAKLAGLAA